MELPKFRNLINYIKPFSVEILIGTLSIFGSILIYFSCYMPWTIYFVEEGFGPSSTSTVGTSFLWFVPVIIISTLARKPVANIVCGGFGLLIVFGHFLKIIYPLKPIRALEIQGLYCFFIGCLIVLIANILLTILHYRKKLFIVPKKTLLITSVILVPVLYSGLFLARGFIPVSVQNPSEMLSRILHITLLGTIFISVSSYFVARKIKLNPAKGEYIADIGLILQANGFLYYSYAFPGIIYGTSPVYIPITAIALGLTLILCGTILLVSGKTTAYYSKKTG